MYELHQLTKPGGGEQQEDVIHKNCIVYRPIVINNRIHQVDINNIKDL